MLDFIGKYRHTLDAKKRLAVPQKLRDKLGREFVICRPSDNETKCVYLYSDEGWHEFISQAKETEQGKGRTRLGRRLFAHADQIDLDAQGRFTVPVEYCEYAGLEKDVVIFGAGDRIEIWDVAAFDAMIAELEEEEYDSSDIAD